MGLALSDMLSDKLLRAPKRQPYEFFDVYFFSKKSLESVASDREKMALNTSGGLTLTLVLATRLAGLIGGYVESGVAGNEGAIRVPHDEAIYGGRVMEDSSDD